MCQAPNDVEEKQLRELHIRTVLVKNNLTDRLKTIS